jgi:hypothetical protein
MIVRQRTQYFALGGGGIGPTAPGIDGAGTAYAPIGPAVGYGNGGAGRVGGGL